MANEIEITVTSKDKSAEGFKSATRAAKDYDASLENLANRADVTEARTLGVKDAVDGVATIMKGPGEQGVAAYLQGWADLASGVANFIAPMTRATLAKIRDTAATLADYAAQKAAANGSKMWAAAQWLLNGALVANPIGAVVLLIAALVIAIVIAYKKSDTFRAMMNKLWDAIKSGAKAAAVSVLGMVDTFLGGIQKLLEAAGKLPGPLGAPFRKAAEAVQAVRDKVKGLQEDINRTRGKTVFVGVNSNAGQSVRSIREQLRSLHNQTVVVNVVRAGNTGLGGFNTGGGYAHGGIPHAAEGGPRGNLVEVGEHGRELVRLPFGSRVYSNPDSDRIAGGMGGSGVVRLVIDSAGSRLDDTLVEILRKAVRVRGGNVQLALGG